MRQGCHGETGMNYANALFFIGHDLESSFSCYALRLRDRLGTGDFDALLKDEFVNLSHTRSALSATLGKHVVHMLEKQARTLAPPAIKGIFDSIISMGVPKSGG